MLIISFFEENSNLAVNIAVDLIHFLDFYLGEQPLIQRKLYTRFPESFRGNHGEHLSNLKFIFLSVKILPLFATLHLFRPVFL